jgi:hypothetical protein
VRNAFAWQVATDADAPPLLLRWAEYLAGQARTEFRASRPKGWGWVNAADTQAVLAARLGDTIRAARIEAELPWQTQPFGSHLAMFLDTLTHQGTPQILGDTGPDAPSITLAGGVLHLTQAAPAPQGARLYAVLRGRGGLAGVLFFRLPPGFSGTQILPLPSSEGPPGTAAPPPIWTDSATTIEIALFDRRGCFCSWPAMGPNFAAYTPDPELAP